MKAKLIKATGEETEIKPANGKDFKLEECYKHLEVDMIEVVYCRDGKTILICDEEGLLKDNFVQNIKASLLAGQPIVGNVIHCDNSMLK